MKLFRKAIIPLFMALIGLGVVLLMLPFGAEAHQDEPTSVNLPVDPQVLGGTDVELSNGTGGSLPEIAASDTGSSVATAYVKNGSVFIRWAQTMWAPPTLLDVTGGNAPKLAFQPGTTNTLHIVWSGNSTVGGTPSKAIRHIRCIMDDEPTVICDQYHTIAQTTFTTVTLQLPDIAIDQSGFLHVAWFDNPDSGSHTLKTVRSTAANNGTSWGTIVSIGLQAGDDGGQPALATAGSRVHLAYVDQVNPGGDWRIEYLRTANLGSPHVWGNATDFDEVAQHGPVSNPTIAAGGTNVYIVWDNQHDTNTDMYALLGNLNTGSGAAVWGGRTDITSTIDVDDGVTLPTDRRTHDSATPPTEVELRPSLALSGTNNFVVVWQERHVDQCQSSGIQAGSHTNNGTSEIYYAESQGNGWGSLVDTLSDDITEYSIDPDIAIDSSGERHIVFMKATGISGGSQCAFGGTSTQYGIYYRGPFTGKWPENDVYLPLVVKNS